MKTTNRQLRHVTIAIGALVLALTAATPALARSGPALTIRAIAVRGNEVAITVANRSARTHTGTVTSLVLIDGAAVNATAPVTAAAGRTVTVTIVMPSEVKDALPLGVVVDDGVPF